MEKSQKKLKILVVDDERGWQELLLLELASEDRDVKTASNGAEALALLHEEQFDLLISDVRMPGGLDGIDWIQIYRRENPTQKAIFITAYAVEEKIVQALQQGFSICLRKPFESQQLFNAIESLLAV